MEKEEVEEIIKQAEESIYRENQRQLINIYKDLLIEKERKEKELDEVDNQIADFLNDPESFLPERTQDISVKFAVV